MLPSSPKCPSERRPHCKVQEQEICKFFFGRVGVCDPEVHGEDLERERLRALRKPYRQAELVSALRDVLAANAG